MNYKSNGCPNDPMPFDRGMGPCASGCHGNRETLPRYEGPGIVCHGNKYAAKGRWMKHSNFRKEATDRAVNFYNNVTKGLRVPPMGVHGLVVRRVAK